MFSEGQGEPHHVASLHIIEYSMCMPLLLIIVYKTSSEFVTLFGYEGDEEESLFQPLLPLVLMGLCMCVTFLSSGILKFIHFYPRCACAEWMVCLYV